MIKKCKKCGMPLINPDNECSCQESLCRFCCECEENCKCGCKEKK